MPDKGWPLAVPSAGKTMGLHSKEVCTVTAASATTTPHGDDTPCANCIPPNNRHRWERIPTLVILQPAYFITLLGCTAAIVMGLLYWSRALGPYFTFARTFAVWWGNVQQYAPLVIGAAAFMSVLWALRNCWLRGYTFLDGTGRVHVHATMPCLVSDYDVRAEDRYAGRYVANEAKALGKLPTNQRPHYVVRDDQYLVTGPILELSLGWFGRSHVHGPSGTRWRIRADGWSRIRVRDAFGNACTFTSIPDAVALMTRYISVINACRDAHECNSFQHDIKALTEAVGQAEQHSREVVSLRDHLGASIALAILLMQEHRRTLGNSPHAQRLREHFERALETTPALIRSEWYRRAGHTLAGGGPSSLLVEAYRKQPALPQELNRSIQP